MALSLDFEALAHADRTTISWERVEYSAIELVQVDLRGPTRDQEDVVEVAPKIWAQFLELVLTAILPERAMPDDDAATQPEIAIPDSLSNLPDVGRHKPDAPTAPNRLASAVTFMRCSIAITFDGVRRVRSIDGQQAMELYSRIYGFARQTGLALPA